MNYMNTFRFILPTRIEFGVGTIERLSDEILLLGAKRPLIITDQGIVKSGILERITGKLGNFDYAVFDKVFPNPRDEDIHNGATLAKDFKADCCIAIGGGSPIDCAKGIAVMATHEGEIIDYEGSENVPGTPLPLITIPTTAGTGSEVTLSSVISDLKRRVKFYFRTLKVAAKVAICDPQLTVTMPRLITAATGMDALTHSIEGLTSIYAEPIASAFALHSITLIEKWLRIAVEDGGNIEARSAMLMGSLLGGLSFSHSSVAAVHALAETLGGLYDLPHGVCNSIGLPVIMGRNKDSCITGYSAVANAMGICFDLPENGAQMAIEAVRKLSADVGIPKFKEFNIPREDYDEIAQKSFENSANECNPIVFTKEDYLDILEELSL
jgi:alcohol dehydrogenase